MQINKRFISRLEDPLIYVFFILLWLRMFAGVLPDINIYLTAIYVSTSSVITSLLLIIGLLYLAICVYLGKGRFPQLGLGLTLWTLSLGPWVLLAARNFQMAGLSGLREWGRLLVVTVTFFSMYFIARRWNIKKTVNFLLFTLPVPMIVGYIQIVTSMTDRISGPMVHPNAFGLFLVTVSGLLLWRYLRDSGVAKYLWVSLLMASLVLLAFTVSSNSWLMFFVLFMTVALMNVRRREYRKKVLILGLIFLIGVSLIISLQPARFFGEVRVIVQLIAPGSATTAGGSVNTLRERISIWRVLIQKWKSNPVFGYGLSTANYINPIRALDPHNDYVKMLVNCGAVGLFLFLLFETFTGAILWRNYRRSVGTDHGLLGSVVFGLFLGWVIASFGDNIINVTTFQLMFWSIIAVFSANFLRAKESF